jgi:para-nitrobenzyl esterase
MRLGKPISSVMFAGLFAAGCGGTDPVTPGETPPEPAPLVVETDKGEVEGVLIEKTRSFLGIPFAAPPTGVLRWKPPAPHEPWTERRMANKKGPMCPQFNVLGSGLAPNSGEDCLTLNVWTPERPASEEQPVLVWIHGGGFTIGSGGDNAYDGRVLSESTGSVVVSLNYRLGPLGFLALPELASESTEHPSAGDYGLEDQRAALEWVKANIAAFGGDPSRVTLFGESAGGISTCMQVVSPLSKGLFQRAIIQSGPCDSALTTPEANTQGAMFVEALGCTGAADVLGCLREKPTEEVMNALPGGTDFIFGDGAKWYPVLDGYFLPDLPSKLFASKSFEMVPTILGSNADEGTIFFALGDTMVTDDASFVALVEKVVPGQGQEILKKYPASEYGGSSHAAAMAAVGDSGFVCPTRRTARALAAAGVPTYLYHFTYEPTGTLLPALGSFHSAEIKYVLGNPSQIVPQALTDEELVMSAAIMGYWNRFAVAGDPNGADAIEWPKYDQAKDENLVLDMTISKGAALKSELCDFWDTIPVDIP